MAFSEKYWNIGWWAYVYLVQKKDNFKARNKNIYLINPRSFAGNTL